VRNQEAALISVSSQAHRTPTMANTHRPVWSACINMAFSMTRHGFVAHPLLYGLSLLSRTLGTGTQLLPLRLNASRR
jgi:hypothetical protein